jgi:hypothetical protein
MTLVGCGESGPARVGVSGSVSLDEQALNGDILFIPEGAGQSARGKVENGVFSVPQQRGLTPGKYRVEIVAYQPTGKQLPDTDVPGGMTDELRQVVPARYNRQSELVVDIDAEGADQLTFKLQSKAT